jgi:hypothetical protein
MKILHQYGAGIPRLSGLETLRGTTVIYVAKSDEVNCYECDYEIRTAVETNKAELRAVRQQKLSSGVSPGVLPQTCLQDELAVACGPGLSADTVSKLLETLARKIRKHGLVTGHDERGRLVFDDDRRRT